MLEKRQFLLPIYIYKPASKLSTPGDLLVFIKNRNLIFLNFSNMYDSIYTTIVYSWCNELLVDLTFKYFIHTGPTAIITCLPNIVSNLMIQEVRKT